MFIINNQKNKITVAFLKKNPLNCKIFIKNSYQKIDKFLTLKIISSHHNKKMSYKL